MTRKEIIERWLEGKAVKAKRLNIPRITIYSWRKHPHRAKMSIIKQDAQDILKMISELEEQENAQ
jgi:hypothetical protein